MRSHLHSLLGYFTASTTIINYSVFTSSVFTTLTFPAMPNLFSGPENFRKLLCTITWVKHTNTQTGKINIDMISDSKHKYRHDTLTCM